MKRRAVVLLCLVLTMCGRETTELSRSSYPVDAAKLSISPGPVFLYGQKNVGASISQTFQIQNTGMKTATGMSGDFGLSITFSYPGGYPGTGGSCADSLAAGATCSIVIEFTPQYVGSFEQTTRVTFHNGYAVVFTDYPVLRGEGT